MDTDSLCNLLNVLKNAENKNRIHLLRSIRKRDGKNLFVILLINAIMAVLTPFGAMRLIAHDDILEK